MASRDLFLRKDWWAKRKDLFLNPQETPRTVNLCALVDPWPGTLDQFRALFYREAKAANLHASTEMINEALIQVNVMLRNPQEDEERRQLLRRKLSHLPADMYSGPPREEAVVEYQRDPRCDCGATDERHAPSCAVCWPSKISDPLDEDPDL